ncbi:MAG: prepilin-type N-terminal cleavage/methylation domain-containing protein [Fusobacterium sp.]|nr:prepilin-type N-terminal cleavage/methylation domain-containing protein [Fusobacterium sp.]
MKNLKSENPCSAGLFSRGGGGYARAFTMAEILLSLTIIGVVAAITLPSLTGNINERTWNTQRKALYSRISQAISLMPALNGYGTLTEDASGSITQDTATETFLTAGLSKVLKINNICDNEHLADCGIVTSYTNMIGATSSMPKTLHQLDVLFKRTIYEGETFSATNTKAAAFETQNGESILAFYNHGCKTQYLSAEKRNKFNNLFGFIESNMCVNFVYDLNGTKGPNTVGKDIGFITVFNATDSIIVAPMPSSVSNAGGSDAGYSWENAGKACTNTDPSTRIPNIDELGAMIINKDFINLATNNNFWSGTVNDSNTAWFARYDFGVRATSGKSNPNRVRCIKR